MDDEDYIAQSSDLTKLEQSGLPRRWVQKHPDGWDDAAFQGFIQELKSTGFGSLAVSEVHQLLVDIHEHGTPHQLRHVPRDAPNLKSVHTANRFATADWADPVDFAERHRYSPGDLWLGRDPINSWEQGFRDERHAMILGSTRGHKGTTCIVPAHLTWPGSLFSLDPKGENATICAARRGEGNDHCIGMGQAVHVVDPFGEAKIEEKYRKRFNPLDALDPDDPEFIEQVGAIADAIVVRASDEKEPFWNNKARSLIKGLILHIKTSPLFEGRRNLITLRELAVMGDIKSIKAMEEAGDKDLPDPFEFLFKTMQMNDACGMVIPGIGTEFYNLLVKKVDRQWSGFHSALTDQTEFLDSPLLQKTIEISDFSLRDIKEDPKGVSLFLCLPTKHMATYHRWLRVMTNLVIYECRRTMSMPASKHRVLMCLDEFRTLEHMPEIERDISNLAGYGVKLMMVLQDLSQLQRVYRDGWQTIWGSCGLVHAFAQTDGFTLKHLSEHIGETDLTLDVVTHSRGVSSQETHSINTGSSETRGSSTTHTKSHSESTSLAFGRSVTEGTSTNSSYAKGWSKSRGKSGGWNRGTGSNTGSSQGWNPPPLIGRDLAEMLPVLREGETAGLSQGKTRSTGKSGGWNRSRSVSGTGTSGTGTTNSKGHNSSETKGTTAGISDAQGESYSQAQSSGHTQGLSRGENMGVSLGQTHHKRPLIYPHDIKYYFASLNAGDASYPGLGLVLIPSERPMVVQRVNYYEDDKFDGLWDFNPVYPQTVPKKLIREWHLGFAIEEPGCLWEVHPPIMGRWLKAPGDHVQRGEAICEIVPGPSHTPHSDAVLKVYAPVTGTLLSIGVPTGLEFMGGLILGTIRYHLADALRERNQEVRDEVSEYNRGEHHELHAYRQRVDEVRKRAEEEEARRRQQELNDAAAARAVAERRRIEQEAAKILAGRDEFLNEADTSLLMGFIVFPLACIFALPLLVHTFVNFPTGFLPAARHLVGVAILGTIGTTVLFYITVRIKIVVTRRKVREWDRMQAKKYHQGN